MIFCILYLGTPLQTTHESVNNHATSRFAFPGDQLHALQPNATVCRDSVCTRLWRRSTADVYAGISLQEDRHQKVSTILQRWTRAWPISELTVSLIEKIQSPLTPILHSLQVQFFQQTRTILHAGSPGKAHRPDGSGKQLPVVHSLRHQSERGQPGSNHSQFRNRPRAPVPIRSEPVVFADDPVEDRRLEWPIEFCYAEKITTRCVNLILASSSLEPWLYALDRSGLGLWLVIHIIIHNTFRALYFKPLCKKKICTHGEQLLALGSLHKRRHGCRDTSMPTIYWYTPKSWCHLEYSSSIF